MLVLPLRWRKGGAPTSDRERYSLFRQVGLLTAVPFVLAAAPLLGFFLGRTLDRRLSTHPWMTAVLVALGFAAAARQVAHLVRLASREDDSDPEDGAGP